MQLLYIEIKGQKKNENVYYSCSSNIDEAMLFKILNNYFKLKKNKGPHF